MTLEQDLETNIGEVLEADSVRGAKRLINSKSSLVVVGAISCIESALPIPLLTDPFLIAAILIERKNYIKLILISTLTSVLGGVFAFYTAAVALELLMQWMPAEYFTDFNQLLADNQSSVFMLSFAGALTPIPYTAVAWVVAVMKGNIWMFIIASIIGRGIRYGIVGFCAYKFGPVATKYIKKYITQLTFLLILLAIIYFLFILNM